MKRKASPFPTDEFQFYNRTEGTIAVYRAKTVVFDLLETVAVAAYLFALYAAAVVRPALLLPRAIAFLSASLAVGSSRGDEQHLRLLLQAQHQEALRKDSD